VCLVDSWERIKNLRGETLDGYIKERANYGCTMRRDNWTLGPSCLGGREDILLPGRKTRRKYVWVGRLHTRARAVKDSWRNFHEEKFFMCGQWSRRAKWDDLGGRGERNSLRIWKKLFMTGHREAQR